MEVSYNAGHKTTVPTFRGGARGGASRRGDNASFRNAVGESNPLCPRISVCHSVTHGNLWREPMKKNLMLALCALFIAVCSFAGDAASYDDIGFSADGKYYLFGQYGKLDKTYVPWAEIFTVDVAANTYVKGDVFTSKEKSPDVSGKSAYDGLKKTAEWRLSKYKATPASVDKLLYNRDSEDKSPTDKISFRDFDGILGNEGFTYDVQLVPTYTGSGEACRSKFFITMQKKDESGALVTTYNVGTPNYERKGVTGYQIERIFTDASGKSLVFVVRKTQEDASGTSIRYMVETCVVR